MPASKQSPNARFLFQFRVRDDELAAFRAAAEKANTNPSEWARTVLRREAGLWTGQREERTMITSTQIEQLLAEALEHGDEEQARLCDRARFGDVDAIRECERVISAAKAQRDDE